MCFYWRSETHIQTRKSLLLICIVYYCLMSPLTHALLLLLSFSDWRTHLSSDLASSPTYCLTEPPLCPPHKDSMDPQRCTYTTDVCVFWGGRWICLLCICVSAHSKKFRTKRYPDSTCLIPCMCDRLVTSEHCNNDPFHSASLRRDYSDITRPGRPVWNAHRRNGRTALHWTRLIQVRRGITPTSV